MAMLLFDGNPVKDPSSFKWSLEDISAEDAGRTDDTIMHKNRVGQKRKLSVGWNNPNPEEMSDLLIRSDPEYINVTYPDAKSGKNETRSFYRSTPTAPMRAWTVGYKRYTSLSFDLIER